MILSELLKKFVQAFMILGEKINSRPLSKDLQLPSWQMVVVQTHGLGGNKGQMFVLFVLYLI